MPDLKVYCLAVDGKSFPNHKWDFGFIKEAFENKNLLIEETKTLPELDRAFVVIAGYENANITNEVSQELKKVKRVVLFVTGDEGGIFNYDGIDHPNIEIWVQSPYPQHAKYNRMPIGSTSDLMKYVPTYQKKIYDAFYSGQVNHGRREELVSALSKIENSLCNSTPGFTQGYSIGEYYEKMHQAKVCPCPAGALTIDSFRFYETIEMLSIPIADSRSSVNQIMGFWELVFGDNLPFKQTQNWHELDSMMKDLLNDYPRNLHKIVSWWIKYKRDFRDKIMEQVNAN
jgi:hypothetical protein